MKAKTQHPSFSMQGSITVALALCLIAAPGLIPAQESGGIGIGLNKEGENLVVRHILPDSVVAASKAIHVGDRIIAVGQGNESPVPVKELKLAEAVRLIRGPKGSTIRLTIISAGKETSEARVVSFVRGELWQLTRWGDGVLLPNGTQAPNIQMIRLPGSQTEQLADHAGKVVVLEFWSTWCGPCQPQMAMLQTLLDKHPAWKGKVVLIAASVDEETDTASKHLKAKGWNKTHNVAVGSDAIKAFHVNSLPTTYVIDTHGKVAATEHVLDVPGTVDQLVN